MISRMLYWRSLQKDRIFTVLLTFMVCSFVLAYIEREPDIERTPIPFELGLLFFVINLIFAFLTIRREPLLAYLFLTAGILLNGTLFFFFKYLLLIQTS